MEWNEINDRWARPARTKWMNGDTAAAEELYLKGLKETGGDGHLALRYAEMLEELGRTDEARVYFKQAESSLPIEKYRQEATNGLARIAATSPGVVAELIPDAELREAVSQIFAESIELAHEINPAVWVLTHEKRKQYVRLNIGKVFALTLRPESLSLLLDEEALAACGADRDSWGGPGREGKEGGELKIVEGVTWRLGPTEEIVAAWDDLRDAHLKPLKIAAGQVKRTPYFNHHQPGLVEAIGTEVGRSLPQPQYGDPSEVESADQGEFYVSLARRFMELRKSEDKDGKEIRRHTKEHQARSERWKAIVEWETVGRAELRKALEDTDWILGANKTTVPTWTANDEKAQRLLEAVKTAAGQPPETPDDLRRIIEDVLPTGFSYGFLTEVLTYVFPGRYWELNAPVHKAVELVGYRGWKNLKHGEQNEHGKYFALRPLVDGLRSALELAGIENPTYLDVDLLLYEIGRKPNNFPMLPISIDSQALDALIADLRSWYPDFTRFDDPNESWWREERIYKEELIELFREQLLSGVLDTVGDHDWAVDVVERIRTVLTQELPDGLVQNLLGWRYSQFLRPLAKNGEQSLRFVSAFRELLLGEPPAEDRIDGFNRELVEVNRSIGGSADPALTRSFPTLFLMLQDPAHEFLIRTNECLDVFKILTGRTYWRNGFLTGAEYADTREAARALFLEFEKRGLHPVDLVDVAGFLHMVMARNTWILQANPKTWDIFGFLEDGHREVSWTIPKMADQIRENDTVYFWVSGDQRGIVAQGVTTSEAMTTKEIPSEIQEIDRRYYLNEEFAPNTKDSALVSIEREFADNRITGERLKQHPVLKKLTILKQPMGTIFKVNKQQAVALYQMIRKPIVNGDGPVDFQSILDGLKTRGLYFPDELVANYLLALQTKRFVILTGISGTGKTQLAMSVAEEFPAWGEKKVTEPHDEDSVRITVKPYMRKHRRFVVPARLVEFTGWELSEGAKSMGRLTVTFDGNTVEQSFYRSPKRNVTILLFSGELREWFLNEFEEGDEFSLELLDEDDPTGADLRISKPESRPERTQVENCKVVAVRPDWTDHRGLLGYFNPLTGRYVHTPFLELVMAANEEIERARTEGREPAPFFAVLDEMNLARVEHYFSDLLSCMESNKKIHLHDDEAVEAGETEDPVAVPKDVEVPQNLFIIGTVNVDETTYMFSPKVLDRAFTIELNEVDLGGYTEGAFGDTRGAIALPKFEGLAGEWKKPDTADWRAFGEIGGGKYRRWIIGLNELLEADGRHFGYRVADEISRFVTLAAEQAGDDEGAIQAAFDLAVLQKVLPKMNGTQQELHGPVEKLFGFAMNPGGGWGKHSPTELKPVAGGFVSKSKMAVADEGEGSESDGDGPLVYKPELPRTARKLWRMARRLKQRGFASYIE